MSSDKKEYSVSQIALNLVGACLISGLIIAVTYFITNPIAKVKAEELNEKAMKALVTEATEFKAMEGKSGWYEALKDNNVVAYIVPEETKGYGGTIKMLVAVTPEGKEIDYNIESSNETPGLGDNASKISFRSEFKGKTADNLEVVKDPAEKDKIQAITGATISSRAVTKAVKAAVTSVTSLKEGN